MPHNVSAHQRPLTIRSRGPSGAAHVGLLSDWRLAASACVPESQNLELCGHVCDTVVEVVPNPCEVQPTNAGQGKIPSACANLRLSGNQTGSALEFLADGIGRLRSIGSPPRLSLSNLPGREFADLDVKRLAHSRLRSSPISCVSGMVSPRSHCAIASRSILSVSESASNVSSPSRARTVTEAPSGNSPSSSTRPATTFPDATCIGGILTANTRPGHRLHEVEPRCCQVHRPMGAAPYSN